MIVRMLFCSSFKVLKLFFCFFLYVCLSSSTKPSWELATHAHWPTHTHTYGKRVRTMSLSVIYALHEQLREEDDNTNTVKLPFPPTFWAVWLLLPGRLSACDWNVYSLFTSVVCHLSNKHSSGTDSRSGPFTSGCCGRVSTCDCNTLRGCAFASRCMFSRVGCSPSVLYVIENHF